MRKIAIIVVAFFVIAVSTSAQSVDSLTKSVKVLQEEVGFLKKIKFSGYVQTQFQMADSAGAESFVGGNFKPNVDNRFMIRRGRLKMVYTGSLSQYCFNIQAGEDGMRIYELYWRITEPWLKSFSLGAGIIERNFGNEIPYSGSSLESPERTRGIQSLFNGEQDLGALLTIQAPASSPLSFAKLEVGLFNGTGPKTVDFDGRKDFNSHLTLTKAIANDIIKVTVGASYYRGGFDNQRNKHFEYSKNVGFESFTNDSLSIAPREFSGFDGQILYKSPVGLTQLRGEYIWGRQSGTAKSNKTPELIPVDDPKLLTPNPVESYYRNFATATAMIIQNIANTKHKIIAKYDFYDPNTKVSGFDISALTKTSNVDIKYTTLGFGWIYDYNSNLRLLVYYDMVTNESTNFVKMKGSIPVIGANYRNDLKDNILTIRFQYKF